MSDISSVYNELRARRQLCDAVIRVNRAEFHLHKVVLCCCSSYFRSLFTHWSPPHDRLYDIDLVSPDIMQLIVDFAYTGSVSVAEDRIRELFVVASYFGILDLIQVCQHRLEEQLTPRSCLSTWRLSDLHYNPELRGKALAFTLRHFEEVVASSEEFPLLSVEELVRILEDDRLNVKQEETTFEAVMSWINSEPERRRGFTPLLVSKLRLAQMSPNFIRDVVAETEAVKNSEACQPILRNALELILGLRAPRFFESSSCSPLARPRLPPAILLAAGGCTGNIPIAGIEAYDIRADRWLSVDPDEGTPRASHGAAVLSGSLYCVGGRQDVEPLNTVDRFDLRALTWQQVAPMHSRRSFFGVTVLDGFIYALGGCDGYQQLRTAERYQPSTNQWTLIAAMQKERSHAGCTALRGKLYICGGFDGIELLSSAERYDPESNQWTLIPNMDSRRAGNGVVAYADRVFAVGGFDGIDTLSTAEAFDPDADAWRAVTSMSKPRSNFGVSVLDGRLFVVGGLDSAGDVAYVESYDAETGTWSHVADMQIRCSSMSCCVADGLDNMADYAGPRDVPRFSSEDDEMKG
ncbi:kelch-like protein 10 [Stegastes partitus]|nr:PREDICTED: kelch-like protein 10 [Stegastes partitus]